MGDPATESSAFQKKVKGPWAILLLGAVLTAVLSLSVHVVLLDVLHVPYPEGYQNVTALPLYINFSLSVLAAIWLYRASHDNLARFSLPLRCLILFALIAMLNEDLIRAPLMNGIVTSAWWYSITQAIPKLAVSFLLAVLIVPIAPYLQRFWHQLAIALLISSLLYFVWLPFVTHKIGLVLAMLPQVNEASVIRTPYGWNVLIPAYLTYAEPVIACFALYELVRNRLVKRPIERECQFILLILLVKNGLLLAPFIYAFSATKPFAIALLSVGQFSLEALVLALSTAISWRIYHAKIRS